MRVYLLYMVVGGLGLYAWRSWFKALCGLVVLMAFIEHPDMPKNIAGIQGLNPWNLLMLSIVAAWLVQRRREGLTWDLPRWMNVLLLSYLAVVLISFARLLADRSYLGGIPTGRLVSEYCLNTIKWVVPGLLLFDGCRSRKRLALAVGCTAALYVLLAAQVFRCTSLGGLFGGDLEAGRRRIQKRTGYNAVDMSAILAGASWGLVAVLPVVRRRWRRGLVLSAALGVVVAQALTGGRMGYAAWGAVGLLLCMLRWRRYLVLAPLVPVLVALAFPGVTQRMLQGFGAGGLAGEAVTDDSLVTSGRSVVWPYVIDKVLEAPLFGHGRLAMIRTGLRAQLPENYAVEFAHPHNAYLEMLLDNGVVGLALVLAFYGAVVVLALRLFRDRESAWCSAVGGLTLALVLAQLVAALGSQHFYPEEGTVGMWAAIGLALRVWRLRCGQPARRRLSCARVAPAPVLRPAGRYRPVGRPWHARRAAPRGTLP